MTEINGLYENGLIRVGLRLDELNRAVEVVRKLNKIGHRVSPSLALKGIDT